MQSDCQHSQQYYLLILDLAQPPDNNQIQHSTHYITFNRNPKYNLVLTNLGYRYTYTALHPVQHIYIYINIVLLLIQSYQYIFNMVISYVCICKYPHFILCIDIQTSTLFFLLYYQTHSDISFWSCTDKYK